MPAVKKLVVTSNKNVHIFHSCHSEPDKMICHLERSEGSRNS